MDFKELYAGKDDDGRRLDRIVRALLPQKSTAELCMALRKGLIKLNEKKAAPAAHVVQGDKISVAAFLLEEAASGTSPAVFQAPSNSAEGLPFDILLQTEDLLFINKPYDTTVQGAKNSLNAVVAAWFKTSQGSDSLSFTPGPLHRLDRRTTGVLAFSLSLRGAKWFSERIQEHSIKKEYVGILQGTLTAPARWEDFLTEVETCEPGAFHTVRSCDAESGKRAITSVTPLAYGSWSKKPYTLARLCIETGRKHQIRAQSALHGVPLLGDTAYGGTRIAETEYFLHAVRIRLPDSGALALPAEITAPLPEKFAHFLKSSLHDYEKCSILSAWANSLRT